MYSSNLENCVMVKLFAGPPTAQWPQKASANTCHQIPSPFPSITPTPPTPLAPKPLPVSGPLIQKPAIKYHCRQEQWQQHYHQRHKFPNVITDQRKQRHPIPIPSHVSHAWTNAAFLIKHFCSVSHFVGQTMVPSGTVRAICWWKRETQKCVGAKVEWWPWKAGWGKLGEMSNRDQVDLRDLLNLSMRDNFNLSVKDHLSMNLRDYLIIGVRDHLNLTEHLNGKTWMCCSHRWPCSGIEAVRCFSWVMKAGVVLGGGGARGQSVARGRWPTKYAAPPWGHTWKMLQISCQYLHKNFTIKFQL